MTEHEIFNKLVNILKKDLKVTMDIKEDMALIGDGILDSMELMSYVTIVEETFNVEISNTELEGENLGVIKNMMSFLKKKAQ